jgi:hypothetical protein
MMIDVEFGFGEVNFPSLSSFLGAIIMINSVFLLVDGVEVAALSY